MLEQHDEKLDMQWTLSQEVMTRLTVISVVNLQKFYIFLFFQMYVHL